MTVLFFPMNPKELKKQPEKLEKLLHDPGWCLQLKRDGVRGVIHIGSGGNRIFSRNSGVADPLTPLEMTKNLPTLANAIFPEEFHGCALDCEIYHPDKTSSVLAGALNPNRVEPPVDYEPLIQYWVFDIPILHNNLQETQTQRQRNEILATLFNRHMDFLIRHEMFIVESFIDNKAEHLEQWLSSGEEGGVLKNLESKYLFSFKEEGKRSANTWVKCKKSFDGDFIITGFTPADVDYTGKDEANWIFWQTPDGVKYQGNQREVEDIPITRYHFYGWIGAVKYGAWIALDDLVVHEAKYPDVKFKKLGYDFSSKHDLIEIGQTSGFTDELRQKFTQNPEQYIGRVIKITGMEQFPDTLAVRHPALTEGNIRWDKNPKECKV